MLSPRYVLRRTLQHKWAREYGSFKKGQKQTNKQKKAICKQSEMFFHLTECNLRENVFCVGH